MKLEISVELWKCVSFVIRSILFKIMPFQSSRVARWSIFYANFQNRAYFNFQKHIIFSEHMLAYFGKFEHKRHKIKHISIFQRNLQHFLEILTSVVRDSNNLLFQRTYVERNLCNGRALRTLIQLFQPHILNYYVLHCACYQNISCLGTFYILIVKQHI